MILIGVEDEHRTGRQGVFHRYAPPYCSQNDRLLGSSIVADALDLAVRSWE